MSIERTAQINAEIRTAVRLPDGLPFSRVAGFLFLG